MMIYLFTFNKLSIHCHAERNPHIVMLNEVKHLYNKDSSLTLRMTVSVIIYIVTFRNYLTVMLNETLTLSC